MGISRELEELWYAVEYDDDFLREVAGEDLSWLNDQEKEIARYLLFLAVTYDFFWRLVEEQGRKREGKG